MSRAKRWAPWTLLVVVAIGALIFGLHRSTHPTLAGEVTEIASEVRCPVCNGESAAESQSAPSVEIRNQIRADLQQGMSSGQILDSFVASYGEGILEKPETTGAGLVVWVLPVVVVSIAAASLVLILARWRRSANSVEESDASAHGTPIHDPEPVDPAPVDPAPSPVAGLLPVESFPGEVPQVGVAAEPLADPVAVQAPRVGRRGHRKLLVGGVVTALVAALGSWAVVQSSTTRLPGETVSGQALGPETILADLDKARGYVSKGDVLDAVKSYQQVLSADPTQVDALTEEGWLLAQTGEPALVQQGIAMMRSAEQSNPSFSEAHLYRGLALLSEDDYSDAIPELRWYLDHSPDPQLVAKVGTALKQAQDSLRTSQPANGPKAEPSASPAPKP